MPPTSTAPRMTAEDQRQLAETLGISRPTTGELTLPDIKTAIDTETDPEFASMGEGIRSDLSGKLDAELLNEELENIATQIDRLPSIREAGVPSGPKAGPDTAYREVAAPGWRVYDHFVDVGFFESVEANLPRFTPRHIEHTAKELVRTEPLTSSLVDIGFSEHERTTLMMDVVTNNDRLALWVPTKAIPEDAELAVEHIAPLHQRAAGGALLWIDALDTHLWQKQVLITDEMLDNGHWETKAMLGGLYVMTTAANAIAGGASLTDSQLTAALTASAAIMIVNQEAICNDLFRITEEMRAPSELR
jgi:hypothetical protein